MDWIRHIIGILGLWIISCSFLDDKVAGTGSETETGKGSVVGRTLRPDGSSAVNAKVSLRPIVEKQSGALLKKSFTSLEELFPADTTIKNLAANDQGEFELKSIDTGKYYLQIIEGFQFGLLDTLVIVETKDPVNEDFKLKHLGVLQGRLDSSLLPVVQELALYVVELDTTLILAAGNEVVLPYVPPGDYSFTVDLDNTKVDTSMVGLVDTIGISIVPAQLNAQDFYIDLSVKENNCGTFVVNKSADSLVIEPDSLANAECVQVLDVIDTIPVPENGKFLGPALLDTTTIDSGK